jgi:hypothetical protein
MKLGKKFEDNSFQFCLGSRRPFMMDSFCVKQENLKKKNINKMLMVEGRFKALKRT